MTTVDDVQRTAAQQLAMLEDLRERLSALTVREVGDGGRVTVEVDVSGALTGLELSPGAGDGRPAGLADAIVTTAVRAATRVFAERAEIMEVFVADFADLSGVSMEPDTPAVRLTLREPNPFEGES